MHRCFFDVLRFWECNDQHNVCLVWDVLETIQGRDFCKRHLLVVEFQSLWDWINLPGNSFGWVTPPPKSVHRCPQSLPSSLADCTAAWLLCLSTVSQNSPPSIGEDSEKYVTEPTSKSPWRMDREHKRVTFSASTKLEDGCSWSHLIERCA